MTESIEAPLRYVIRDVFVQKVEEHKYKKYVNGVGQEAIFEEATNGWFVYLAGSHEALWVGYNKPELKRGDLVTITIEKA